VKPLFSSEEIFEMTNNNSYEKSKAFVLAFSNLAYEPQAFELVSKGVADNERRSASIARKGMRMALADILEDSAKCSQALVVDLDRRLRERGAPTLTEMRATSLGFVKKLLKKKKITSEEEFLVLRGAIESGLIADEDLTAELRRRLMDYEGV
jgi:hypothetical protein